MLRPFRARESDSELRARRRDLYAQDHASKAMQLWVANRLIHDDGLLELIWPENVWVPQFSGRYLILVDSRDVNHVHTRLSVSMVLCLHQTSCLSHLGFF